MSKETTIVHISDPHYGTEDKVIAGQLLNEINEINPDVVVVSGDLTQRATKKQFKQARALLESIKAPKVVIPGNHDLPFFNIFERFIDPYKNYRKFISGEQYPQFVSGEIEIAGINSCSPFRSQTGRIKDYDIDYLKDFFSDTDSNKIRGVAVHHNIFPFKGMKRNTSLINADSFLTAMLECKVDLIFAGHLHKSYTHTYTGEGVNNSVLILQAGTCISHRLRKEENTYIVITGKKNEITVEFRAYDGKKFAVTNCIKHKKDK